MARRRRGGHGGHASGERWLLTYADLITLLLALFIIMYGMSQTDKVKYKAMTESMAKAFNPIQKGGGANDRGVLPPASEKVLPAVLPMPEEQMLKEIKSAVEGEAREAGFEGKIEAKITERGLVISFSDAVFFQKGEAGIRSENLPLFRKLMLPLSRMPNSIRIEGHTDDDPIHTERFPSNWELSTSRATSVVRYLIQSGLFGPKRLAAAGFGEYWPKAPNDTAANQAKNRRVDVVVLRSTSLREKP
ncbi:MAG TPA: hypothetical protein DD435_00170 [Cyanobacteria bacterium UBA8530]|nr:hypothetical protein [Cyanobacteria bacterium UBA8530]